MIDDHPWLYFLFLIFGIALGSFVGYNLADIQNIRTVPKKVIIRDKVTIQDVVYAIQVDTLATDSLNRIAVRKLVKK